MLDSLKDFIISNNIITTMAAVTIAFSTGTMIRSLAGDIILPALYSLIFYRINSIAGAFAPINKLNMDNFIKEFLSWIIVIIVTFFLIGYVFKLWVVSKSKPTESHIKEVKPDKDSSTAASITEYYGGTTSYGPGSRQANATNKMSASCAFSKDRPECKVPVGKLI